VVVALEVAPRFGKQVTIGLDDFVLKTDKDGSRTTPFTPSQIAGRGALVISSTGKGPPQPHSGAKEKDNPMLKVLTEKELPETKTDQPASGLLYFPMEKQKPKDLELRYVATPDDKIVMRFHQTVAQAVEPAEPGFISAFLSLLASVFPARVFPEIATSN
jgi:hypothetical protein